MKRAPQCRLAAPPGRRPAFRLRRGITFRLLGRTWRESARRPACVRVAGVGGEELDVAPRGRIAFACNNRRHDMGRTQSGREACGEPAHGRGGHGSRLARTRSLRTVTIRVPSWSLSFSRSRLSPVTIADRSRLSRPQQIVVMQIRSYRHSRQCGHHEGDRANFVDQPAGQVQASRARGSSDSA